ncbi:hypothetical protein CJF31_00011049 [Rutstroemia sp. NJR-2017a BVV2]|nr:hypothetical protein CJF31_00011049 [Rutstroemia sp. NJR-2017a BVV2]
MLVEGLDVRSRAMGLCHGTGDTGSVVQAKKYKIWKSSTISTLLALSDEAHMQIGGLRSTSENEKAVEKVRAALRHDADGEWRLRSTGSI